MKRKATYTDYNDLIRKIPALDHVNAGGVPVGGAPINFNNWESIAGRPADERSIINEIIQAQSRVPTNRQIQQVSYINPPGTNNSFFTPYAYPNIRGADTYKPTIQLLNNNPHPGTNPIAAGSTGTNKGPLPYVVGHEVMHANHYGNIGGNMVDKNWEALRQLALAKNNTGGRIYQTYPKFQAGIKKVQDKIDPTGAFGRYKFDRKYLGDSFTAAIPALNQPIYTQLTYNPTADITGFRNDVNVNNLFDKIKGVTTASSTRNNFNPSNYFHQADEFNTFATEPYITQHWNTSGGLNPLNAHEANFTWNVLNNLNNAYPNTTAPTLNRYIRERANSLDSVFAPGGVKQHGYAGKPLATGGHVKSNDLLMKLMQLMKLSYLN